MPDQPRCVQKGGPQRHNFLTDPDRSDTVLVARLRALGYTTALPAIQEDTPEPEVAGAWYGQRLSGPEQARGPTLLQRMLATRQVSQFSRVAHA